LNDLSVNLNKAKQQYLSAKKASTSKKKLFLLPFFDFLSKVACLYGHLTVQNLIKLHSKKPTFYAISFAAELPVLILWKE
jgi:hypothetical protein